MAIKRTASGQPLVHLLMRLLGLTGVAAAFFGLILALSLKDSYVGLMIIAAGTIAMGVALLFELKGVYEDMSSRRGAFGLNVFVQIVLAIAVVAIVNVISFNHYWRFDCTSDHAFTLPKHVVDQLAQLRGTTDIIVLQQYVSFGQRTDNKQDKYDLAAQRKIVEKVKDLAEQFQDLGPRFRVQVLDIQDDDYTEKLSAIRKQSAELATAIEQAPENSIFFHTHATAKDAETSAKKEPAQIQRLSFSDIYQLDKQASEQANGGNGNLVLKYQGVDGFARKIFNIEEKKPRIATAIIHPVLGLNNRDHIMFTMNGAKKALDAYGFESTDIMLRKIEADGGLTNEPTALSYDEGRYEQIEDELAEIDDSLRNMEKEQKTVNDAYRLWSESSLAELNKTYVYFMLEDGRQGVTTRKQSENLKKAGVRFKLIDVDEEDRKLSLASYKREREVLETVLEADRASRKNLLKEKSTLRADRLAEKRRITDVAAKMTDMLANVDLLIVPRFTLMNAPRGMLVENRVHKLDPAQLKAIKGFMREGKPVLFLLGPTNEPNEFPERGLDGADQLETALAELGFQLPKQTILYNVEAKEYNERKVGVVFSNRDTQVPGLRFDDTTEVGLPGKYKVQLHPHPIRTSLTVISRAAGNPDRAAGTAKPESYDVRIRHPRPVYFMKRRVEPTGVASLVGDLALPGLPGRVQAAFDWFHQGKPKPDEDAVFLVTRDESWNEDNPFLSKNHVPRYLPPKDDDPKKGTIEGERLGPFPIGAAAEVVIPESWYDSDDAKPRKERVAIIGSGSVFVGPTLSPIKEKMLLDVVDWLLGRDDLLAKDVNAWEYPRVHMSETAYNLWNYGARFGFFVLFIYLGTIVWLIRHVR